MYQRTRRTFYDIVGRISTPIKCNQLIVNDLGSNDEERSDHALKQKALLIVNDQGEIVEGDDSVLDMA
jgi:hypothetical protein